MGIRKWGISLQLRRVRGALLEEPVLLLSPFVNGHARGDGSPKVYRQPRRLEK
jgi:hypothetical protein